MGNKVIVLLLAQVLGMLCKAELYLRSFSLFPTRWISIPVHTHLCWCDRIVPFQRRYTAKAWSWGRWLAYLFPPHRTLCTAYQRANPLKPSGMRILVADMCRMSGWLHIMHDLPPVYVYLELLWMITRSECWHRLEELSWPSSSYRSPSQQTKRTRYKNMANTCALELHSGYRCLI